MVTANQQLELLIRKEIKYTSIKLSEILERGSRLEASYYDEDGRIARDLVENCKFEKKSLNSENGFSRVWHRPRFRRVFVEDGIPIFTASQILELKPKPYKFVSSSTDTDLDQLYLKYGQIVMTCSGIIGRLSLVTKTLDNKLFSHDLLRIDCFDNLDIGYLYAFLKSKIGNKIITTNNYGSVVTHIEPDQLSSVMVPNPPTKLKKEISDKIFSAFKMRDEANELINKSINILFQKLNLIPIKKLNPKNYQYRDDIRNYEVKASRLQSRLDSSFHVPIIDDIVKQLERSDAEITTVSNSRVSKKVVLPGRFKRIYVDEEYGKPFLGGGDIMQFNPTNIKYLSLKGHGERIEKELNVHENMILVTCSGTIGNVVLAPKYFNNWSCSQHIIRIVPSDQMNPGYLYAFLTSEYGHELIKRYSYGSVVSEIDDNHVSKIPIPLLSKTDMNLIGNLVLEANDKRDYAFRLEKEAINEVQNLILNNQTG